MPAMVDRWRNSSLAAMSSLASVCFIRTLLSIQARAAAPMQLASSRAPCDSGEWLAVSKNSCTGIAGAHTRRWILLSTAEAAVKGSTTAMPAPASTSERAIW